MVRFKINKQSQLPKRSEIARPSTKLTWLASFLNLNLSYQERIHALVEDTPQLSLIFFFPFGLGCHAANFYSQALQYHNSTGMTFNLTKKQIHVMNFYFKETITYSITGSHHM